MPKRSSKDQPRPDENETAFRVAQEATGRAERTPRKKNPAAVALGRLGGKKGGKARAAKLSPKRRKEIAQLAAHARWSHPTASDISGPAPLA